LELPRRGHSQEGWASRAAGKMSIFSPFAVKRKKKGGGGEPCYYPAPGKRAHQEGVRTKRPSISKNEVKKKECFKIVQKKIKKKKC